MMCLAQEKFITDSNNQPLHKRLMSSTRKLLQRRFCCCCVDELGAFKKSNEPTVVLTKSETITSQPGARIKTVSNGTANGGFNRSEEGEQLHIAGPNNEFDEIDLNGDVQQSTSADPNKDFLKPQLPSSSVAGTSGTANNTSSAKSKSSQFSLHDKQLAENVTDMMFNEICEMSETIEQEIVEEENFEIDLHAVSEATEDEISDFEATSSRQKPSPLTLQNNNLSKLNIEPEDPSPRSLSSANQPLSASSSSLKSTGRDVEQEDHNDINNSSRAANSVPNTPSSTTSSQLPPKPPRTNLHSSVEELTAGVLPINENRISSALNGVCKEIEKPAILPKPNGFKIVSASVNSGSRMYGGDDSSDESESKLSSSPFSIEDNDEVQELKSGGQTKKLDKRNGKQSKEIEQFDYKALETDLSERTN